MARVLTGTDNEKFAELCAKTYKEQAVWFMNAFWEEFAQNEAEKIWEYTHRFAELDHDKKTSGNALDELQVIILLFLFLFLLFY